MKAKAAPLVVAAKEDSTAESAGPVDSVKNEITVESKKIGVVKGTKGATLLGIQGTKSLMWMTLKWHVGSTTDCKIPTVSYSITIALERRRIPLM